MSNPFLREELWPALKKTHDGTCERHVTAHSVFSTYFVKINLLSFQKGRIQKEVRVLGLPPSISLQGYDINNLQGINEIESWLKKQKGHTLIINSESTLTERFSCVSTLPSVILENKYADFHAYLGHLRSHYRYRALKAMDKFKKVSIKYNEAFSPELYELYEAVFNNSHYPLAKNEMVFFEQFPATIEQFYVGDHAIGFCQYYIADQTLYFMFCGIDYKCLKTYDTYINMLLIIIGRGIEAGVKFIDLGQTTETIKQKLGGKLKPLYVCHFHRNPMMRKCIRMVMPLMGYRPPTTEYHVFKTEGDC